MTAKALISVGAIICTIGIIIYFFPNAFKWFGNLPGDFKSKGDNVSFYFPLTSMILISVVLNVILRVFKYLN